MQHSLAVIYVTYLLFCSSVSAVFNLLQLNLMQTNIFSSVVNVTVKHVGYTLPRCVWPFVHRTCDLVQVSADAKRPARRATSRYFTLIALLTKLNAGDSR